MRPLKVEVSSEKAEAWAFDVFGIAGIATPLPGDIDRNFLLDCGVEGRWVMKIANAAEKLKEVECQVEALRFLRSSSISDVLPAVRTTVGGASVGEVEIASGERCCVRLLSYQEGRPIAGIGDPGPEMRAEIGTLLGRLDQHLQGFEHVGTRRKLEWDLVNFLEIQRYMSYVDAEIRPLVDEVMARFERKVVPRLELLRRSVVHNDANDYNILIAEDGDRYRLSGLIDFGDLVHTITVAELAIASAYLMLAAEEPLDAAEELRSAYETIVPLTEFERSLLPELSLARLCTSVVMAAQARAVCPEDDYMQITGQPARRLLRRLL